ncbi:S8 family serine peptidase [Caldalkalibacillus mannanilyticus]|uniref:S8 family serine peptidase n=1 Tax=Caldalkalibacillus mannanilyticus TaxID=1418 RepID=UPI0004680F27|nr:S8 family serine peptidase [Caldalkalibacillus mannanilyticus]
MKERFFSKIFIFLLTFALVFSSFGMGVFASNESQNTGDLAQLFGDYDLSSTQSEKVIVELHTESIIQAKHNGKNKSSASLTKERSQVIHQINKNVDHAKVGKEYEYLFSGFALELPSNQIPALLAVPGVKAVYPNVSYTVTSTDNYIDGEVFTPHMAESAPFIGADHAWANGITGEGIVVAILDTGVDYTHPDLVHAFGEYKGWDFIDHDNDPQETPPGDPRGGSTTHGSHVAGTVAANGVIKGVAPDATLLAYRVLGPGGTGSTEGVVAGIERAVQDGAHVMNLSLGNTLNTPDWATSIALDWAMAEGVVAVTSNGNAGPNNWTVGSPGTSRQAISVGATQLPYNEFKASISTSEGVAYPSAEVMGHPSEEELLSLNEGTYEFVHVGLGYKEDFVGKDVEGKIALVSRGEFAFIDKAKNAKEAGAIGVVMYNQLSGPIPVNVPGLAVPTIKLSDTDGQKMINELAAGNNEVSFNIQFDRAVGETVAAFSSRGPVVGTWMIKPDVAAPGVNITSTVPTHNPENPHGYSASQGTSMSSPHVAGAAALLLQANPSWGVYDVKSALMNTSERLIDPATGQEYPHNTQGAGSIRIPAALDVSTLVDPGSHSFGVFDKKRGKEVKNTKLTIKNLSDTRKRYSVQVEFKGNPVGIHVSTSNNLQVKGKSSTQLNLKVQVDASRLEAGYYEGSVVVSDGEETIHVPTILFVQEPDYSRVTHFSFTENAAGELNLSAFFPNGAENAGLWIYTADGTTLVGDVHLGTNLPPRYNNFTWNKTIEGEALAPGEYRLYVHASKAGQTNYVYGGTFKVTE